MDFKFITEDLKRLQRLQKKPYLHPQRYKKVTMLIMLHQEHSVSTNEAALGLDDNMIRHYVRGFEKLGLDNYLKDGYIPYSGFLTAALLIAHHEEHLYLYVSSVMEYFFEQVVLRYSVSDMTQLLHGLGFVYKKSKAVLSKADEQAQYRFLTEQLPEFLEAVERKEAVIYYADGCHPTHNTQLCWEGIRRSTNFTNPANCGRQLVNINVTVNALKPEHLVFDIADQINAKSAQGLYRQLLYKHLGKTIYLICYNAPYNRNNELQKWAERQQVEFIFLPTYSLNLSLIERMWCFIRVKVMNSIYYECYQDFRAAIHDFLHGIKQHKAELRNLLTLNFQTLDRTSAYAQTI